LIVNGAKEKEEVEFKYSETYATMVQSDDLAKRFEKLVKVLKKIGWSWSEVIPRGPQRTSCL
jgi:hypothetical protein